MNDKQNQNARKYDPDYDSNSRLYNIYKNMLQRCYNPKKPKYPNYGARGIVVCDEWKDDYNVFKDWAINNGYRDDLTIERVDVNGNYEPNNCKWITNLEQMWNRTDTLWVMYKGKQYCMSHILRELGLLQHMSAIKKRMKNGCDFEKAVSTPFDRRMMITYNGVTKSIDEWAQFYGIKKHTLYRRMTKMKLSFEEAITYKK